MVHFVLLRGALEDKIAEHFALSWHLSVQLLPMLSSPFVDRRSLWPRNDIEFLIS